MAAGLSNLGVFKFGRLPVPVLWSQLAFAKWSGGQLPVGQVRSVGGQVLSGHGPRASVAGPGHTGRLPPPRLLPTRLRGHWQHPDHESRLTSSFSTGPCWQPGAVPPPPPPRAPETRKLKLPVPSVGPGPGHIYSTVEGAAAKGDGAAFGRAAHFKSGRASGRMGTSCYTS